MKKTIKFITAIALTSSLFFYNVQANDNDTYLNKEIQQMCVEIGEIYNISPELLMAIIEAESSGKATATSHTGDFGLMQINPKYHQDRMNKLNVSDITDEYSNILLGADYLNELIHENGNDLYLVLMKYNMNHQTAEIKWLNGQYTEYATNIVNRAMQIERANKK